MALREVAYRFELRLDSSPERLWPLVSDTNRFNRDAGVPAVEELGVNGNARRRLRLARFGLAARLVSLSSGDDLVVSDAVLADHEVASLGPGPRRSAARC